MVHEAGNWERFTKETCSVLEDCINNYNKSITPTSSYNLKMSISSGIDLSTLSEEAEKDLLNNLCARLDKLETREKEVYEQHEGVEKQHFTSN